MKTFFGGYAKKRSSWSLWGKICRQKLHKKLSGQLWGNSGKILRIPKMCLLLHLWWKDTSAPVSPLLKGQRGKCPRNASILRRPCVYYFIHTLFTHCCKLQYVTELLHKNWEYAWSTQEIFVFYYMWFLYVYLLRGEKIRACVSRYDQSAWNAN